MIPYRAFSGPALVLSMSLACLACLFSIDRTLTGTYKRGHIGSAAMFARVVVESGADLILKEDPKFERVLLSDLSTVKPNGGEYQ